MKRLPSILTLVLALLSAREAHAYIDPGTGSAILQALVAAILGIGLALKLFWQRIKAAAMRLFTRSSSN